MSPNPGHPEPPSAEETLGESQERYELALAGTSEGIWDWNLETHRFFFSSRFKSLLGYGADEFPEGEDPLAGHVHPDDAEKAHDAMIAHLKQREPYNLEFRLRTRDGMYRWFRTQGQAIWNDSGHATRMAGAIQDITESRLAQQSLEESGERLRAFVEDNYQGIFRFEFDPPVPHDLSPEMQVTWMFEHGRVAACNRAYVNMFEFDSEYEALATPAREHFGEDFDGTRDLFRQFVESDYRVTDLESREQMRSGEYRWFHNSLYGVSEGEGLVRLWGTTTDVTVAKSDALALHESERRYRATFDHAPIAIVNVTADGHLYHLNQYACDLLGYTYDELKGKHFLDITHPEDATPSLNLIRDLQEGGNDTLSMEKRYLTRDGATIWSHTTVTALRDAQGHATSSIAVFRDISERKRAEHRQRLMMHELDHRVKNNLASVLSLIDLSMAGAVSVKQFAGSLRGRIEALAKAHELLTSTKLKGVDLRSLVRTTLAPYSDGRSRQVIADGLDTLLPRRASAPMAMALHELAVNAAKYGALSVPGGGLDVAWRVKPGEVLELDWLECDGPVVQVSDEPGLGIKLIRGMIEHEMGGKFMVEFYREGLSCTLQIPLDTLRDDALDTLGKNLRI